jgi:hypothetical protein
MLIDVAVKMLFMAAKVDKSGGGGGGHRRVDD